MDQYVVTYTATIHVTVTAESPEAAETKSHGCFIAEVACIRPADFIVKVERKPPEEGMP